MSLRGITVTNAPKAGMLLDIKAERVIYSYSQDKGMRVNFQWSAGQTRQMRFDGTWMKLFYARWRACALSFLFEVAGDRRRNALVSTTRVHWILKHVTC